MLPSLSALALEPVGVKGGDAKKTLKGFDPSGNLDKIAKQKLRKKYGNDWWKKENKADLLKAAIEEAKREAGVKMDTTVPCTVSEEELDAAEELAKRTFLEKKEMEFRKSKYIEISNREFELEMTRLGLEKEDKYWKLNFRKHIAPVLDETNPGWKSLPEEARNTLANEAKAKVRADLTNKATTRAAEISDRELEEFLKSLEEPAEEAGKKAREEAKGECLPPTDDLSVPGIVKRRYRAVLRFVFNRKGKDGKTKSWHECPKPLKDKRIQWALSLVQSEDFDPLNIPAAPDELFDLKSGDVKLVTTSKDLDPSSTLYDQVEIVSTEGGQKLWKFMRFLEQQWPVSKNKDGPKQWGGEQLESGSLFFDEGVRTKQKEQLTQTWAEYMAALADLGSTGASYIYTQGSGRFNRFLLYARDSTGKEVTDPTKIPAFGMGKGSAGSLAFSHGPMDPMVTHQLYRMMQQAPRTPTAMHFLRAVRANEQLPHRRNRKPGDKDAMVGDVFPNVTFTSTTIAAAEDYYLKPEAHLDWFYDVIANCCFMIISVPANFPILPMVVGKGAFDEQQEIVLPPGGLFVYRGKKTQSITVKKSPETKRNVEFELYEYHLPSHPPFGSL